MPLMMTFFVTLMNCDLCAYSHITYNPLQGCDYRQKKILTKQSFYARMKVPIVLNSDMDYSTFYYALLDLKKVVIFAYFNLINYIADELLNS
jgi:hypothetical protein